MMGHIKFNNCPLSVRPVVPYELWVVTCFSFHATSTVLSTMGTYSSYSEKPEERPALPANLAWTNTKAVVFNSLKLFFYLFYHLFLSFCNNNIILVATYFFMDRSQPRVCIIPTCFGGSDIFNFRSGFCCWCITTSYLAPKFEQRVYQNSEIYNPKV